MKQSKGKKSSKSVRNSAKITAHYLRLSREDEQKLGKGGDSNSIENQAALLSDYSERMGYTNIRVFKDDGISGVTFDRKEFQEMLSLIEAGEIERVIVKDLSRLGRNHIEVGQYMEYVFPQNDIHFIAVLDNVDIKPEDFQGDFLVPIKNIFNEMFIADTSRKLRATQRIKSSQGYPIGKPPYGYRRDPEDRKRWVIDDDAAEIVQRIYRMRLDGQSVNGIADIFRREKVDIPSVYAIKKGYDCPNNRLGRQEYLWSHVVVRKILLNQSYVGDVINFKTFSKSYKLKERLQNDPEDWEVHTGVHEPVIDRETWEQVQRSFESKKRKPKHTEKNMFAGFLKCSDCGGNLRYKFTHQNPDNHYFSCGNNREKLCKQTHHIRIDVLEKLLLESIANAVRFAREFEDEFVKIVVSEQYKQIQIAQKRNQTMLASLQKREGELDILFAKIYEDNALGVLPDAQYQKLCAKYQDESIGLTEQIRYFSELVKAEKESELDANSFLKLVRRYTRINKLTPEILRHFINKVVVHHRVEDGKNRSQQVEIYFNFVGQIDLPEMDERSILLKSFSREKQETATRVAV